MNLCSSGSVQPESTNSCRGVVRPDECVGGGVSLSGRLAELEEGNTGIFFFLLLYSSLINEIGKVFASFLLRVFASVLKVCSR